MANRVQKFIGKNVFGLVNPAEANAVQKYLGTKVLGLSVYEGANRSTARGWLPGGAPRDAKDELTSYTRRELVSKTRYLLKNSGFMRGYVGDMDIYSVGTGMRAQAQTTDAAWNSAAEEHFKRFCFRADITNRFSFAECQSLVCRAIDSDGEVFVIKVRDRFGFPRIQLIESHRCQDDGKTETTDGIQFGKYGEPIAYSIRQGDATEFRMIPANAVMHIFEPELISAARSAPPMQHSINHLQDENELLAIEKRAVKDNSGISRLLTTEDGTIEDNPDFQVEIEKTDENGAPTDPTKLQEMIGGIVAGLKPGEKLESFESKRPSPTFTGFLSWLQRDSSGGGLPHEFTQDPSKVGGASVRLITAKAGRRFEKRQQAIINRILVQTWAYVIGDAIDRGELKPVKDWYKVRYVTPRKITVDAGRESRENRADVETGLKTLEEHYKELGMDFEEQLEIRARNAAAILKAAEKYKVPIDMIYKPSGGQSLELLVGNNQENNQ
jgi:lambda family phage portal protein